MMEWPKSHIRRREFLSLAAAAGAAAITAGSTQRLGVNMSELRIEVVDERGEPVWARLEVRGADGKMYPPEPVMIERREPDGLIHGPADILIDYNARTRPGTGPWYAGSFVTKGEAVLV